MRKIISPENSHEEVKGYGFKKIKDKVYATYLPSFLVQYDDGKVKAFHTKKQPIKTGETKHEAVERLSVELDCCYLFVYESSLNGTDDSGDGLMKYVIVEEECENVEAQS